MPYNQLQLALPRTNNQSAASFLATVSACNAQLDIRSGCPYLSKVGTTLQPQTVACLWLFFLNGTLVNSSFRTSASVIALTVAGLVLPGLAHAKRMGGGFKSRPAATQKAAPTPAATPAANTATKAAPAPAAQTPAATNSAAAATPAAPATAARPSMMGTMGAAAVGAVAGTMAGSAMAGAMGGDKAKEEAAAKQAEAKKAEAEAADLQKKADEAKAKAEAARAAAK